MKKAILALLWLLPMLSFGQQVAVNGVYSSGSAKEYSKAYGFGLGYELSVRTKRKISFTVGYSNYSGKYNDITNPDGISYSIAIVEPSNIRLDLGLSYTVLLVNNQKSKIFLGPSLGLNYFFTNQSFNYLPSGDYPSFRKNRKEMFMNRIGLGLITEMEVNEVFSKRISLAFIIKPEITSFEEFYAMGSNYPWFIGWLNFNLGFRYKLTKAD